MIQSGPCGINLVDWEKLDDEEVFICSTHSAHEVVFLQLDTRVSFAFILDDVAWHSKMLWETSFAHDASECHCVRPIRTEAASFVIVADSAVWVLHLPFGLHAIIPWAAPSAYLMFRSSA
jgi:hypothetical protein